MTLEVKDKRLPIYGFFDSYRDSAERLDWSFDEVGVGFIDIFLHFLNNYVQVFFVANAGQNLQFFDFYVVRFVEVAEKALDFFVDETRSFLKDMVDVFKNNVFYLRLVPD